MAEADLPPERDVKDFKFQQLCKVRVTGTSSTLPKDRVSLITASSKYGLTFVAAEKGFKVFRTSDFVVFDQRHASDRLKHIITDLPVIAGVNVGYEVTHLSLSADELTLAIAITRPEHAVVYLYDVRNFATQVTGTIQAFHMMVGEGSKPLNDLSWNPVDPNLLILCYCTGRLDIYNGQARKASLSSANAKCVCWSPKGKQLVAGREDGSLVQYDPDLNEKRKWDTPTILTTVSTAFDLVWLSTYSFLVAYISVGADCSEQPSVVLINGSKDGPTMYSHFEDICYGSGEERERKYYFSFIQKWDLVLAGSSNAAEIGIVGKHLENKQVWERWSLDDSSRAECPLTDDYVDTYPMGVTVDFSSQYPIPLGDERTFPTSPILLILSTQGLIIPYHMMYMNQSAPAINAPAQALDTSGLRKAAVVPASPASQQGVVKNLFGSTTAQPVSKPTPASAGFAFSAANLASSTTKAAPTSGFSMTGGSGGPASTDIGTVPKFGTNPSLAGTTAQPSTGTPGLAFATGTGAPVAPAKSDQSETKPPLSAGFGMPSFAGSTNKSGANAGFSVTPSFGVQAGAGAGSFTFKANTTGDGGFPAKPAVTSDAVPTSVPLATTQALNFGSKLPGTSSQAQGFAFAAKVTDPGTTRTTDATAQPAGFGLAGKGTDAGSSGFKPTTTGFGATATGIGKPVSATSNPISNLTGQSSAFTGMPSASAGKPLHKPDSQNADLAHSSAYVPKSPTRAPPPIYPSATRAESPKFAPPPQYPSDAPNRGDQPDSGETTDTLDQPFSKSIFDEIEVFNKQLVEFRRKASQTNYIVGTQDDMKRLKQQTQEMDTFCTKLKANVQEQSKEAQEQRALSLDMFSMVEECRMRQHMDTDPKSLHLHKSRALDPGSAVKLQQLQLQYQVLDQGLRDVDLILDTQWEEYQTRKKNKTNRVQNPTNDAVYRVVKSNHNLILAQKSKLKELEERLKQLKLYNKTSAWNNTTSTFTSNDTTTELSHLADTLLSRSPEKPKSDSSPKEEKSVNRNRLERLREHLCRRNVSVIRSTKPENLSVLTIPDSQLETSMFRNSKQHLTDLPGARRHAGEFVGMFNRTPLTANNRQTGQAGTSQPGGQTVRAQNEKNKQDQSKDKDGKVTGFFKKIIQSGEKIGHILLPKSQAKPTVTPGQGLNVRPPTQQAVIPKTVQTAFQDDKHVTQSQQSILSMKEINGIKLEDITPSGSENDVNTEEDDEYDDESSGSNGEGFGYQYNMQPVSQLGRASDLTPVAVKAATKPSAQDSSKLPSFAATSTPISRKLFPADETKPAPSFNFGGGTGSSSMKFGADSSTSEAKSRPTPVSKPFTFTPTVTMTTTFSSQSETSKQQTGFNFSMSGAPSFGAKPETQSSSATVEKKPDKSSEDKPKAGQITGLFGKDKPPTVESGALETQSEPQVTSVSKPPVVFGQSSGTSSSIFGQPKSTAAPSSFMFGQPVSSSASKPQGNFAQPSESSVIGQPSDAVTSSGETTENSGETTPQTDSTKPSSTVSQESESGQSVTASTEPVGGNLFGQPSSGVTTATPSSGLFGQTAGSAPFGQTATASGIGIFGQTATTPSGTGLFGQTATTTSGTSLFGQTPTTTASGTGLFCQTATTTSGTGLFGQTPTTTASATGLFGQTATTTSGTGLFGQTPTTTASATGLFGQTATTTPGTGLFGQTPTTASGTGLFGQTPTTTSGTSLFGQTATTTPGIGLFGQTPTTTASATGLFGQTPTTTASATGLFGQTPTTTPGTGLFGQTATTTASGTGLFGQTATTTSGASLFGQTTTAASTAGGDGLFGQKSTSSSAGGLFGQSATSASSTGGLFGQSTPATSSEGPFGQGTSSTGGLTSGGLFGQSATTSSGGLFGQSGGSPFGQTSTSGSGGLFGSQTSSSGGLFGQPQTTSSSGLFGQTSTSSNGGLFGSSTGSGFGTATSGSGFGFGQSASPGFGQSAFGQSPGFGHTPSSGSPFGQSSSDSGGGGGGGMFSGLGGKPSAEKANTNVFGAAQPFGTSEGNSQNLFGGGTSQSFGSGPNMGGGFSSGGTFSAGTGVGSTGFGAAKQTGTGGFGGSPAFGSGPSFGGTPAFGNTPGFGSPPAFGSAGSPGGFGSTPTFGSQGGATFGAVSQQGGDGGGGFAGFAGGQSPTFGGLAQTNDAPTFGGMSQPPNTGGFGGNTGTSFGASPSFTGYRG